MLTLHVLTIKTACMEIASVVLIRSPARNNFGDMAVLVLILLFLGRWGGAWSLMFGFALLVQGPN